MAPKKWSDEMTVKFVEAYKSRECLWNQFDPLYKNKHARITALREIGEEMILNSFGVVEVKAKIKSLRSTYHLEQDKQRKSEKSGAGSEDVYVPIVKWFQVMKEIMTKGTLKRQNESNLKAVTQHEQDFHCDFDGADTFIDDPPGIPPREQLAYEAQTTQDINLQNNSCESQNTPLNQPPAKKFRPRLKIQQIASTARQLQQLSDSLNSVPRPEQNEFDIFGNLVAAHLKKLSPVQASDAEIKILEVLNNCRKEDGKKQKSIDILIAQTPPSSSQSTYDHGSVILVLSPSTDTTSISGSCERQLNEESEYSKEGISSKPPRSEKSPLQEFYNACFTVLNDM